ncbi:MAG: SDR family NAD(P)-dependent oxidoreductase [Phenylobacterium sp.]|uniref:SDR family NAD(P)-dependent oxidoreductase n=1 Tax=Phenylobacterium sp. TaxID=1871053 RepID=UPI00271B31F1|nr:SDR family NAD(P)-dependent oxidoreductase [Phenylobacterium sp.]MDO8911672.1 SDR family NAD(P)-dependent oxidoreductase [Phenylobacterium sp.]MDP3099833.1 SDR family NAD(P)-dependent oxidoreductase [Phenylobacterium sp.]HQT52227.1 SDR family NAD(P)-dependent oxidoreductase [Phenylobacterium sp.]
MKDFTGRIAVITGGGTGMGRELARQLVAQGCHVAMCDVSAGNMAQTISLCQGDRIPQGVRITAHVADVSDEAALQRFRDEIKDQHQTDHIHLLFNNAGIAGGGSMVTDSRAAWERTFNVCWGGVYLGVRTFLDMLIAAPEAHIVNTSSVNGFWATIGPNTSHTSYAAAKFAVKGFTEALVTDLRLTAPHVKASVVMPGHIGTAIVANSRKVQGNTESDDLTPEELAATRHRMVAAGMDLSDVPDAAIQAMVTEGARRFEQDAPMTAAAAATVILDGVKAETWRILVGDDARLLDEWVRKDPEQAYEPAFYEAFVKAVGWKLGGG